LQNANWNVVALCDTTATIQERYDYTPYGVVTFYDASWDVRSNSSFAWQYLFQGGRFEILTGLYYFRNRDYSPTLGRWMVNDPVGMRDGTNLYLYEKANPVTFLDPFGLWTKVTCTCDFRCKYTWCGFLGGTFRAKASAEAELGFTPLNAGDVVSTLLQLGAGALGATLGVPQLGAAAATGKPPLGLGGVGQILTILAGRQAIIDKAAGEACRAAIKKLDFDDLPPGYCQPAAAGSGGTFAGLGVNGVISLTWAVGANYGIPGVPGEAAANGRCTAKLV